MTTGPWPRAKGSRQRVGRLELWPSSEGLPGCGLTAPLTWCSAGPLVTADARSAPQAAQRPCTYRVPKVASAQLQRLGEELVVGVLVLDVLPHLHNSAVADVEHQDLDPQTFGPTLTRA
jgi:hypothetical protein